MATSTTEPNVVYRHEYHADDPPAYFFTTRADGSDHKQSVSEYNGLLKSCTPMYLFDEPPPAPEPKPYISHDIHHAIDVEFKRAFEKHKGQTPRSANVNDPEALIILIEEVGEVARALTYDEGGDPLHLAEELIQVATMASAWAERLREGGDR